MIHRLACVISLVLCLSLAAQPVVLDHAETAGISGFRALWDMPIVLDESGPVEFKDSVIKDRHGTADWSLKAREGGAKPGAMVFDALQRMMLVRFPEAAERIASELNKGRSIAKVELVLPLADVELWPPGDVNFPPPDGYNYRANWGVDTLYRKDPPRWHAIAFGLRRPWMAHPTLGPTFNAHINGTGYWKHCGAKDESADRHATMFGPAQISQANPVGRIDLTAMLSDPAYGATLTQRLRNFADCGVMIRKWETYDHRYFTGVYEWPTATGGRGIRVKTPSLAITFAPAPQAAKLDPLPPPADIRALAEKMKQDGSSGAPTAMLPTREQLNEMNQRFSARPAWVPDWQWQRLQELRAIDTSIRPEDPFWYPFVPKYMRDRQRKRDKALDPMDVYPLWIDTLLGRQPRGWHGFEASKEMTEWYIYRDALPRPARDAIMTYWTAWLMPDRPTAELVHPMHDQLASKGGTSTNVRDSYFEKTGDWRGNKSFYRAGFNYTISTQNFNMTSSSGALLGGSIIGSQHAMADGRHGQEHYPSRLWTWSAGASQEHIDHYYYAVTLSGNKAVRDFGPTAFDRLLADAMLARGIEELSSAYHPALRRFIAPSSRTSLQYLLVTQDGLQHIMHTLSRAGTLHDLENTDVPGKMLVMGHERTPQNIAEQTQISPWAPEWAANMVDEKPIPYEHAAVAAHTRAWIKSYLGRNYGLASSDINKQRIQVMGQWRRDDTPAPRVQDIVTMDVRYGVNSTRFANDAAGWIAPIGHHYTLQHRNKLMVLTSPWPADFIKNVVKKEGLRSLQTSIALFNHQPMPTWEIYVDDQRVTQLPISARADQRITIRDGSTYMGVIPIPATDLGRKNALVIRAGEPQEYEKMTFTPALLIESYNLQRDEPLQQVDDWSKIDAAFGGFIVELADAADHPDFAAFQNHIRTAKLSARPDGNTMDVTYASGAHTLNMAIATDYESAADAKTGILRRTINGGPATLPEGIVRDTTLTQQGTTGRLVKNGATLLTEPGRMAYLQTEPRSGTCAAFNPLPDLTPISLTTPDGITVRSNGKVSLCRIVVQPKEKRITIDHACRTEQQAEIARSFTITGIDSPTVIINGKNTPAGRADQSEYGLTPAQ